MDASYIITYRSEGESRKANLAAVLAWLQQCPGLQVMVVEQDRAPTLSGAVLAGHCTHLFAFNPGPFNKSWGFNIGFKHTCGQVVAFGDADVMVEAEALVQSLQLCLTDYEAVKPYDRLVDLTPEETQHILAGQSLHHADRSGQPPNREGSGEYICFCGGLFVVRRALFESLGGFDEKFLGWGGEDDAMTIKLQALSRNTHIVTGRTAYHLWHEKNPQRRFGQPFYPRNLARVQHYQRLDLATLQSLCDSQRRSMGNIHKYEFSHL